MALDSQTIPDGPIWTREPETNRTLDFGDKTIALPKDVPDGRPKQIVLLSWGKHLVILGSFFGHFRGHFLDHFLVTFWTTFGCHVGADGPGVIFTAGLGVIFTAGLGAIVTSWRLGLIKPYKAFQGL